MTTQHTQGPLHTGSDGTILYDKDGWAVSNATVFHGRQAGPEVAKENARRLVACWNACEKVSTEDLESIKRPGDVSWATTIDRLARERDKLLEALRDISEESTDPGAVECARVSIAKAAGSAA